MTAPTTDRIPVPTSMADLEDLLHDRLRLQAVMSGQHGEFSDLLRNYAAAVNEKDKGISLQITAEVERVTTEWLRENGADTIRRPDLTTVVDEIRTANPGDVTRYNPQAAGAVLDKEFSSSWEYFATVWHHTAKSGYHPRLGDVSGKLGVVRNAFSSNVPSEGGFLIPETLRAQLLHVALEVAIMRPRAMVVPMETLRVPFPCIDSTSNTTSVFGGVTAFWTEEAAPLPASQASFGRVVLDAKKLTAFTDVPNELLADSLISFRTLINMMFPKALAWYEDIAFIKGSGVGEPLGILADGNPGIVVVAKEVGQVASTIVWENIVKMFSRMLPSSLNDAIWLVTPDAFPELATMALSVGTGGAPIWLMNGQGSSPATLLSRPVIITEKAKGVLGAQGDLSLVDPSFYLIGDRQVMSASSSDHYRFGNDMTSYRVIERVDGRPWLQSAITPQNGGPTLSPYVQLAART